MFLFCTHHTRSFVNYYIFLGFQYQPKFTTDDYRIVSCSCLDAVEPAAAQLDAEVSFSRKSERGTLGTC